MVLARNQFWKVDLYRVGSFAMCLRIPLPCRIPRRVSAGPSAMQDSLPYVQSLCCRAVIFTMCPSGTEHGRGCSGPPRHTVKIMTTAAVFFPVVRPISATGSPPGHVARSTRQQRPNFWWNLRPWASPTTCVVNQWAVYTASAHAAERKAHVIVRSILLLLAKCHTSMTSWHRQLNRDWKW
jgi:hypothetical protein